MRVKEPSTIILFVRHGATDYPEDMIYSEEDGPSINGEGRLQAERLADWIEGEDIAAVFVSPSKRTIETATPIVNRLNLEYKISGELRERRFGIWEGLTFSEIEARYPEGLLRWKRDPVHYTPDGGESIVDLQKRVDGAVQGIIEEYKGKRVLIVTHMGPIRVAVAQALQIPLVRYRHLQIHPGSVTRIDYGITAANLVYLGVLPGGNRP